MEIHARQIAVEGAHGWLLPPTSLRIASGQIALVGCGRHSSTAFGLTLSGRMEPTTGAVLLNGAGNPPALRMRVVLVDAPEVTAPEDALPVNAVVAEELGFCGEPADRAAVGEWLRQFGIADQARTRFGNLAPDLRVELLTELATLRRGVEVLVLDTPDRHGGAPEDWWALARRQARRGLAVVALCADPVATHLGVSAARLGELEQPPPVRVQEPAGADEDTRQFTGSFGGTLPRFAEDMQ